MQTSERFEQLIAFFESQLPRPVEQQPGDNGSIVFIGGAPPEVVVHLTATSVVVSEFACVWESEEHVTVQPRRVGLVRWRRLPEDALLAALSALVRGARQARLARYATCRCCGERNPPEWLYDDDLCQRCADEQRDVVH